MTTSDERHRTMQLDRAALEALQLKTLNRLLAEVHANSAFYQRKLAGYAQQLGSLAELASLPQTSKDELQPAAGGEPFAANRTYSTDRYVRCHQTSGTRGRPLVVLDTADDWRWWIECWQYVLDAADVTAADRALLAFSFGPFIGFWSAFDALVSRGTLVIPGGGLSSLARLEMMRNAGVTTLLCTPTYALRLAEVAADNQINLPELSVEKIIVAGEPGGSVPAIRDRIETTFAARVIDHGGATEIGPWGFADAARRGMHVNEAEFIAEFISLETGKPAQPGEQAHLILTTLGRTGAPVIRYRTGDVVRPVWESDENNQFVLLADGILGRADDMMIIRGMNVYPTAVEQILRSFPEVVEYRMTAIKRGELDELVVEVEDHLQQPERIADELRLKLGLKIEVRCSPAMSLPRFDGKAQRFVDLRKRDERQGDMGDQASAVSSAEWRQ
ncbi:MAG TPA: AMP-binding protein [Lacipirellulaceae bacterium]|nr:AMP-binding protein [Lacipirellulaceae bacterium]